VYLKTAGTGGEPGDIKKITFAYTCTISASSRIAESTPSLLVAYVIFCNLVCSANFFLFVPWPGGSLRPVAVLKSVADEGRAVVKSLYPEGFAPAEEQPGWSRGAEIAACAARSAWRRDHKN
jgi:hypothetical protein